MKTDSVTVKEVSYAYPTSPYAVRLGFGKSGCFYVFTGKAPNVLKRKMVGGFATKEEAFKIADALPDRYGRYSMMP